MGDSAACVSFGHSFRTQELAISDRQLVHARILIILHLLKLL